MFTKPFLPSDTLGAPAFHEAEPVCFSTLDWTGATTGGAGAAAAAGAAAVDDVLGPDGVLVLGVF